MPSLSLAWKYLTLSKSAWGFILWKGVRKGWKKGGGGGWRLFSWYVRFDFGDGQRLCFCHDVQFLAILLVSRLVLVGICDFYSSARLGIGMNRYYLWIHVFRKALRVWWGLDDLKVFYEWEVSNFEILWRINRRWKKNNGRY